MNEREKHGRAGRGIVERLRIDGKLVLDTPAHLGSGEAVGLTDMSLLRDPLDGKTPLLTGASLAGALRNYLHEYERGYGQPEVAGELACRLFGQVEGQSSLQSWLLVDDVLGETTGLEFRDGVTIDPKTRTAEEKKKYDVELLRAGTAFDISFELVLDGQEKGLVEALALALRGLQAGEIGLGQRKRRGLGRCRVVEWRVCRFDVTTPQGLIAWLEDDRSGQQVGSDIVALLGVTPGLIDRRDILELKATFDLDSSLLIRSGWGGGDAPDMVHLHSYREEGERPILSGTSLAGAVRARALRIANTIHGREEDLPPEKRRGQALVDAMFGRRIGGRGDEPSGSRVVVHETELAGSRDLVQSRVKIDRFTGGSYPGALFTQQPAFGGDGATVTVDVALRRPADAEIGLLLLVLKDLWTGDLPLGGESSVGRGRLQGHEADLVLKRDGDNKEWHLAEADEGLTVTGSGTKEDLEAFVAALHGGGGRDE